MIVMMKNFQSRAVANFICLHLLYCKGGTATLLSLVVYEPLIASTRHSMGYTTLQYCEQGSAWGIRAFNIANKALQGVYEPSIL